MKCCIDCNKLLDKTNKSPQQPTLRCRDCFDIFADKVEDFLRQEIEDLKNRKGDDE